MYKIKTKNEPIIACHPPLCVCLILPEVNYKWAKDILLQQTLYVKKEIDATVSGTKFSQQVTVRNKRTR